MVPAGHERGGPGSWAYRLPPEARLLVARERGEIQELATLIPDLAMIELAFDETDVLTDDLTALKALLIEHGFQTDDGHFFTRRPPDAADADG